MAKKSRAKHCCLARLFMLRIPAITDFRAKGTIIGPAGLTAVFGMGTGVAPPVWSPEKRPAGGQAGPGTNPRFGRTRSDTHEGEWSWTPLPYLKDP